MSEQIIWIGERKLALKPENPEISSYVADQTVFTKFEDAKLHRIPKLPLDLVIEALGEEQEQKTGKKYLDQPFEFYSDVWTRMLEQPELPESQDLDKQFQKLSNQIIFDLGNGPNPRLFQATLKKYNPTGYVGVDTVNRLNTRRSPRETDYGHVAYYDTDAGDILEGALIRGDSLRVASRLPDNSVSVAINGLDNIIVDMQTPYGERLLEEVQRIMHPRGLVFGFTAEEGLLVELSKQDSIKQERPTMPEYGIYVFSKV